jgi:RecT family.
MSRTPPIVRLNVDLSGGDKGELVSAYAAAYRDGACVKATWVTGEHIEKTRSDTPAWRSWASRMERKLAIKRLCQELPDERLNEMAALDDQASVVSVETTDPGEPKAAEAPKAKRLAQRVQKNTRLSESSPPEHAEDVPPVSQGDANFYDPAPMSDYEYEGTGL